ncbi:hypothetical protein [Fictibacillus sp. 18YEL24]|uniref:hypothetical protein n=1 Tax=Fictibacillus sp. 18YEL24 TaxID=2745875 RepID=UPI0018CF0119|nr:hypothetical protein [Fictibacillus sp. 18YEL24]MBH0171028.1 hypothetical protein [Fictibacillus sp. 18YEL24]
MGKLKVSVKDIPVRHNGEDFEPGDELVIEDKHFNESFFEKLEEIEEAQPVSVAELKAMSEAELQKVKNDQYKVAFDEAGIEYESNATKAELIALIPQE